MRPSTPCSSRDNGCAVDQTESRRDRLAKLANSACEGVVDWDIYRCEHGVPRISENGVPKWVGIEYRGWSEHRVSMVE